MRRAASKKFTYFCASWRNIFVKLSKPSTASLSAIKKAPINKIGQGLNLSKCDYLNEADRTKNTRHYEEEPPTSVGTLYKQGTDFWCLLFFPANATDLVLQIASANKVKAIPL
ncbi:MAG: hypothetical protein RBT70_01125 [Alphaproteobacteria bacterium]|nr:hypothetical protein [Alphaproteobacteria bacterium]